VIAGLLGIEALLLIALCVLLVTYRWPSVKKILWVAFAVRAASAMFHYFVFPLPDSGVDAKSFEELAWQLAQGGFGNAWASFTGPGPDLISWIIALVYSLTDRSLLLAQALSVFMGTGTVLFGWLLVRYLWGEYAAMKAGWVLVFFPTLVLYSAIPLREAYIWFFLILGLLGVASWGRTGRFSSILLATFGFVGATFFHGAMIIGLLMFLFAVLWRSINLSVLGFMRSKVRVISIALVLLVPVPIGGFFMNAISLSYLGDFSQASNVEFLVTRMRNYTRSSDGGAYPEWTVPRSPDELLYKGPIRMVYFLFAPFPWDLQKTSHLIGLLDSLLYSFLVFYMWRNRKTIWACPAGRILVLILMAYFFVFGLAVGNFGTGIRHRTKFVVILIAVVAPFLPRIRFHRKSPSSRY